MANWGNNEWGSNNWGAKKSVLDKFEPERIDVQDINNEHDYEKAIYIESQRLLHKKQVDQMHDMRDHKYYACIVFVNENDKKEFFKLLNNNIEIVGETFIDGYELAEKHFSKIEMTAKLQTPKCLK
jgi:hypothetical protein